MFGDTLTIAEVEFWGAYNIIQNANYFKVNYQNLTFDETIEEIESKKNKQAERMSRIGKR